MAYPPGISAGILDVSPLYGGHRYLDYVPACCRQPRSSLLEIGGYGSFNSRVFCGGVDVSASGRYIYTSTRTKDCITFQQDELRLEQMPLRCLQTRRCTRYHISHAFPVSPRSSGPVYRLDNVAL